jgi:hypothetical protein
MKHKGEDSHTVTCVRVKGFGLVAYTETHQT